MTGYADPAVPRLSDFAVSRRIGMNDDPWPFGAAGPIPMTSGSIWNPSVNMVERPDPLNGLVNDMQWPTVIFGRGVGYTFGMSGMLNFDVATSGDPGVRQAAVVAALKARLTAMAIDENVPTFAGWSYDGSSYRNSASGLTGRIAYCDPNGSQTAHNLMSEFMGLQVTAGVPKSDWREQSRAWLDNKIENDGWRFFKPWQTYPQVHPLISGGDYSTYASLAMDAGTDWFMGVDFWSLLFKRRGEKVPWVKMAQQLDLRDPASPTYLTTPWQHALYLNGFFTYRLHCEPRNVPTGWSRFYVVETLDGDRPTTQAQARTMLGLDAAMNASVPGLISGSNQTYLDSWYGWLDPTMSNKPVDVSWLGHSMRLYAIVTPPTFSLMGVTSMADMLAQADVKLAYTAELFPYSETGPAADSPFENPLIFDAYPKVKTRMRLSTIGDWDGGAP